jgi:K+ transporter
MDSFPPYVIALENTDAWANMTRSLRIVNTSDFVQGQVYLPMANWLRKPLSPGMRLTLAHAEPTLVMIATIAVVGAFKDLAALTHAFG